MPISRFHIRSEHSLADPELHRSADKDDPEALLEAVAMAGLVGVLRQLGDLAQFAAEIFHDLHEEVTATAARGHSLISRVQQLEAEVPALEKAFLLQTHHSSFFTNGGIDWHPNLRSEQNLVTCGDLPRFIMDSYEECRGPPRMFLLDKFDVAGAGACLKRYTDPSFFKVESSVTATVEVHREKRIRKVKKKVAQPRNGANPEDVSSHAKLHQLFLEERIENACRDPARLVKLRKKQLNGSAVDSKTGKGYMEKILEISSADHKMVCETSITPHPVKLMSDDTDENGIKILEISSVSPVKMSTGNETTQSSLPNEQEVELKPCSEMDRETNGDLVQVHEEVSVGVTHKMSCNHPKVPGETELVVDEQKKREYILHGYHSDDITSEVDDYMDAIATMEELETELECRPKKSLLNIQKVTYSNGEEEHQLQAQFSDSQSFGDSLTSEEIDSFDQDRNGEHTGVQARLSDSQSTRSSSASDDSRSSIGDRIEEHTQLQAQFSDSQSIGNSSTSEIEYMPFNQVQQTIELQRAHCGEFVMHDEARVHGEDVSDSGQVSSGSGLMDSGHSLFFSDPGPISSVFLPTRTQSGETQSCPIDIHRRLEDDDDGNSLVESLIKADACPVVSSDSKSLNNLDFCDPCVNSNALLQVSDNLNLAHEDEYGDHSTIKVLQEESPNQCSSEILVSGDIGSQGEDPICSSIADLNLGTKLPLDSQDLKSENGVIATHRSSEDLSPVLETPPVSSFTEELCSDFTRGNPQDGPDAAEAEVLYSDQQSDFEEIRKMMLGDEKRGSKVEDDGHIKPLSSPDNIRQDNLVIVNDMSTEKVHSDDQPLSAPSLVDSAENDSSIFTSLASGFVSSPSMNLSDLHEPFSISTNSHQTEIEPSEAELTKIYVGSNSEKRENKLEPSSDIISSPMKRLTELKESFPTSADSHEKEMEVNEAVARKSLTALVAPKVVDKCQIAFADVRFDPSRSVHCNPSDSEICSNVQGSFLKEKIQRKVSDQPEIASADVSANLNRSVPCDPSDSEICNNIQEGTIQYGSPVNDMKIVPVSSELNPQRSESIFLCQNDVQNSKDSLSSPSYDQLKPESYLGRFSESPVDQQDAEVLLRNGHYTPDKFQLHQIQISNQLEPQRNSHAASEFASEIHPDEPSSFDFSSKSSLQETSHTKHVMDPLPPLPLDLFVEANNNHEEMPPMPPLPPMQWRMGKVQHAFLLSQREEIDATQASVQPIQPVKHDDKSQFGLSASDREAILYQNPFLPVMAVESNKLQYSSGFSAAVTEHPVASPLQFPVMLNESNGQYNYLVMERSQNQNPFLTLPVISMGRPPHGYLIASEEDMVQNSSPCPSIPSAECSVSGADPISLQEKLTESPSPLMEKTSLDVTDGTGELHLVLPTECAVSGDDPIPPRENLTSRQLTEETSLEVETLEQSSIYLESKQGDPSISPISPQSIEVVQPNDSPLPSKGEMALSSDTSSQTPAFDSEMPNEKPKNKLPHPRSPLVDVVAALDKSKLRKVSERVLPPIAPKVDERDSLLEQIRSKSFNLRPAAATRPIIQGPKTNLRVAAILEKASSIRQALAGSDEDDDADSWSDS